MHCHIQVGNQGGGEGGGEREMVYNTVVWVMEDWSLIWGLILYMLPGGVPLDDDQPKMKLHSDGELYPKGTVFKCETCEKTFQSYQFLKIHTWSHTRPFKCDQCQRDFTRPYHLKAHKFTHSEVKPFTCDYCGKSFCTTSHFKKHMLTHTNPQTFNCNMCSSTFTQEHYLKRHKLRHMGKCAFYTLSIHYKFLLVKYICDTSFWGGAHVALSQYE